MPAESTERSPALNKLIYGTIAVLAVIATLFGISDGRIVGVTPTAAPAPTPTSTSVNPVDLQPAPSLFKSEDLTPVSTLLAPQLRRAATSLDAFYDDQPTGGAADDTAFVAWASRQITREPSAFERRREIALLADLDRSNKAMLAAQWLGVHGCRDVWSSYVLEQQRFYPDDDQVADREELDAVLSLAARVTSAAQRRFADNDAPGPAPCAPRRTVDTTCACSFPSSSAAASAAARTYLAALGPISSRQYAWMEQQVDMAAVYQGFELPSDVEAGAFLGYLVGNYFLESHGYARPTPTPSPTVAR